MGKVEGLGDVIDVITTKTGVKSLVKLVAGEDCGCEGRREKLNVKYPFKKNGSTRTDSEVLQG